MAYKKAEEIYLIYIETRSFIKIRKNFKMYNLEDNNPRSRIVGKLKFLLDLFRYDF